MKLPLAVSALLLTSLPGTPGTLPHTKIINLGACAPMGAAIPALPAFGPIATGTSNAVGTVNGTDPVALYCDAALPDDATVFDSVDLEYFAWAPLPGPVQTAPSVVAYVDAEGTWSGRTVAAMTSVASCTGIVATSPFATGISRCSAWARASLQPAMIGGQQWRDHSVHFVVTLPAIPQNATNEAYRLLVHYRGR